MRGALRQRKYRVYKRRTDCIVVQKPPCTTHARRQSKPDTNTEQLENKNHVRRSGFANLKGGTVLKKTIMAGAIIVSL